MPGFFAPFMWSFFGIMILCLALSLVVKDNLVSLGKLNVIVPGWLKPLGLPSWLIGGVGVAYCVCVAVMAIYASQRMTEFWNTPFVGVVTISLGDSYHSEVYTGLLPGYFTAWGVGLVMIVMGLNRYKFLGIPLPTKKVPAAK
jgi:hypothetical protein